MCKTAAAEKQPQLFAVLVFLLQAPTASSAIRFAQMMPFDVCASRANFLVDFAIEISIQWPNEAEDKIYISSSVERICVTTLHIDGSSIHISHSMHNDYGLFDNN